MSGFIFSKGSLSLTFICTPSHTAKQELHSINCAQKTLVCYN